MGATADEHNDKALEFAEQLTIDMPSAYSVLLGVMTFKQALAAIATPHSTAGASRIKHSRKTGGAAGAGDRLASGIDAVRHARQRAREAEAERQRDIRARRRRLGTRIATAVVAFSLPAVALLVLLRATRTEQTVAANLDQQRRLARAAEVTELHRNEAGEIVRISGPDAPSVLAATCLALERSLQACDPLEIRFASPPSPVRRIGVVEAQPGGELKAIEIHRTGAQAWEVRADGGRIPMDDAPAFPAGTPRIRI
ncbi:MAG: hypothetical protein GY716_12895 [bacterium]|nr:hypothetical protein [bacterium]